MQALHRLPPSAHHGPSLRWARGHRRVSVGAPLRPGAVVERHVVPPQLRACEGEDTLYLAYISPTSRLYLAYISPISRLTCASAREMIAAVTPEPHDVTSCSAAPTPAVSKAAWRRSGGSILPSSPSRLPNGKLRDPGMWPERQSARGLCTRRAQGHLSSQARGVSGAPVRAAAQGGGGGAHSAAVPSKRAAGRASTTRERRPGAACRFSWI